MSPERQRRRPPPSSGRARLPAPGATVSAESPRRSPETQALLERYLTERTGRNLSPLTLRNYRTDLGAFFDALVVGGIDPLAATRTDLRRYLGDLLGRGVAAASVTRKVSTIRSFYRYLRGEGSLSSDPFFGVRGPRAPRRLPGVLTEADVVRLIQSADGSEPADRRDRALLELLYAAGLRVSEVAGLDTSDVDLRDRVVRVRGKGSKERVGVFGAPAAAAIARYLRDGRSGLAVGKETALFLNRAGGRLSVRSVQSIVRKYAAKAGLLTAVHPHLLRHSYATHLLDGGADLRVVQELLGHESPNTTQVYLGVTEAKKRQAMEDALEAVGRLETERRRPQGEQR